MTDLKVRRLRFDFTAPVPMVWHPENPRFSHAVNLMSFIAICFEKMIVEAVQEAKPRFTDPEVASEANAFLRQEAQHANAHRQQSPLSSGGIRACKKPLTRSWRRTTA